MTESRTEQTGGRAVLQCRRVTMQAFQVIHRYHRFVVLRCSETIARGTPRRYRFQPNRGRAVLMGQRSVVLPEYAGYEQVRRSEDAVVET